MKICVLGAGATGGYFASQLALAGHDVGIVTRGAHLEAIQRDGLVLLQADERHRVQIKATDDARRLGVQDLVIVGVKATGLAAIASSLAPLIDADTAVVFPQNGMPWWYPVALPEHRPQPPTLPIFSLADRYLELLQPGQIVGGVIYSANEVLSPGVIRNVSPGHNALVLGDVTPNGSSSTDALRLALCEAGIDSAPVIDIRAEMWCKLVGNASSSTMALVTGDSGAVVKDAAIAEFMSRAALECTAVAAAHGYDIRGRVDIARWRQNRGLHKPSLLQDYEQGRAMEIAEIAMAPVAFARSAGVPTPSLDALSALAARKAADKGLFDLAGYLARTIRPSGRI